MHVAPDKDGLSALEYERFLRLLSKVCYAKSILREASP